jgi:hypothetical protein
LNVDGIMRSARRSIAIPHHSFINGVSRRRAVEAPLMLFGGAAS